MAKGTGCYSTVIVLPLGRLEGERPPAGLRKGALGGGQGLGPLNLKVASSLQPAKPPGPRSHGCKEMSLANNCQERGSRPSSAEASEEDTAQPPPNCNPAERSPDL